MTNTAETLSRCYATRGGMIDPWGTFRALSTSVPEPNATEYQRPLAIHPGLAMWSDKLIPFHKRNCHVRIGVRVVHVLDEKNNVVQTFKSSDFLYIKELHEVYVHPNGYLQYAMSGREREPWQRYVHALNSVTKGERPQVLDNSPFTKVDPKFAGKILVQLTHGDFGAEDETTIVYTKDGELVPSFTHRPLSFAKWDPTSRGARYSVRDRKTH